MKAKGQHCILMIGTALNTQGGVSSVVNVLREGGLFERNGIEYIATHRDGGPVVKFAAAVTGWLCCMGRLLGNRPDLLHVHMSSRASFWRKLLFFLPAFTLRVPVIVHLHGGGFKEFYLKESPAPVRRLIRFVFERATRVIVLAEGWKEWVMSVFPNARVVSLYNPVMLPKCVNFEARESTTLLFLGRVCAQKGAFDLIEGVARLKEFFPAIRLLMGGDGELAEARRRAVDLGLYEQVELLGWVRGEQKQTLLETAAIYVLPSYHESLPMSVLEAMANGLPVISTLVGGIPEAVSDGIEGYLVEPGDVDMLKERLAGLLRDEDLRRRMGKAGRLKVEHSFSTEVVVPQFEALYAELLSGK
ncbi:MAG: glycosyltransferase family 4 protein [Candidatus Thiodiazotropha endolucinida]